MPIPLNPIQELIDHQRHIQETLNPLKHIVDTISAPLQTITVPNHTTPPAIQAAIDSIFSGGSRHTTNTPTEVEVELRSDTPEHIRRQFEALSAQSKPTSPPTPIHSVGNYCKYILVDTEKIRSNDDIENALHEAAHTNARKLAEFLTWAEVQGYMDFQGDNVKTIFNTIKAHIPTIAFSYKAFIIHMNPCRKSAK